MNASLRQQNRMEAIGSCGYYYCSLGQLIDEEAVTGRYNSGNMNTGTYCSVLVVELQNKIPVDRRPLFP